MSDGRFWQQSAIHIWSDSILVRFTESVNFPIHTNAADCDVRSLADSLSRNVRRQIS
jgi:hypothetical protein